MRENKRKKKSNKPTCPACGAVITVRCEAWHNRLGRCLRHSHHTGPHYFAAKSIQDDPIFWEALQDPWTVVYFPKPGELGRDSASFMINVPVELSIAIDKYLSERRFETRSELIIEAVQTWIDCEEDDDFGEIAQKHDEDPSAFGCLGDDEG